MNRDSFRVTIPLTLEDEGLRQLKMRAWNCKNYPDNSELVKDKFNILKERAGEIYQMNYTVLENKLNELLKLTNSTSSPKQEEVIALMMHIKRLIRQLKKNTERFQESSDMLRIVAKYQLFDLEATRRENSCLKKLLKESNW